MVNPRCHKVLVHNLVSINNRLADILTARCRNRVQSQVFLDCWVYWTLSNFRRGHLIYVGNPLGLTDSFIVCEKEGLILNDRPADASANDKRRRCDRRGALQAAGRISRRNGAGRLLYRGQPRQVAHPGRHGIDRPPDLVDLPDRAVLSAW